MGNIGIPEVLIVLVVVVASVRVWRAIPPNRISDYLVLGAVALLIVLLYVLGTPVTLPA